MGWGSGITDKKHRTEDYEQVEGRNPVIEALRGPRDVRVVYLARGVERSGGVLEIIGLASEGGVDVVERDREELDRMSRTHSHQGAIARVAHYRYVSIQALYAAIDESSSPLVLVLDGVEDPQNFGSILRVADAAAVDGVVVAKRRSSPVTPAVVKASAGAVEHVRVVQVANIANTLVNLKERGLWVVGAESDAGEVIYEVDLTAPTALVLGGEGKGISRLIRERCDFFVRLPMRGHVTSLNVSTAAAVFLFEAVRQRSPDSGER